MRTERGNNPPGHQNDSRMYRLGLNETNLAAAKDRTCVQLGIFVPVGFGFRAQGDLTSRNESSRGPEHLWSYCVQIAVTQQTERNTIAQLWIHSSEPGLNDPRRIMIAKRANDLKRESQTRHRDTERYLLSIDRLRARP